MDAAEPQRTGGADGRRARRAAAVIALSTAGTIVIGVLYLHGAFTPSAPPAVPTLPSAYSASYDFVSPSTGWALVADTVPGSNRLWVYTTDDGARQWREQFTTSTPAGLPALRFFDRAHGMISILSNPSLLYQTADGGTHWQRVASLPGSTVTFSFADPSHGWLETRLAGASFGFRLFSTSDGGRSWAERSWPAAAIWGYNARYGMGIEYRGNGEGWIGSYNSRPTAYLTRDDGVTWRALPIPLPATASSPSASLTYTTEIALLPGAGVIAVVVDRLGQAHGFLSSDYGSRWRVLSVPGSGQNLSDYVFQFQDSTHWWLIHSSYVYKTADAGLTWRASRTTALDDRWTYEVHVIDASHAWASMQSLANFATGLATTADGGISWKAVSVPGPPS
jgi:photosystem II stability/assembly factor-like uncharacterized protein